MMKFTSIILLVLMQAIGTLSAQMVSYTLQQSLTKSQLDSIINSLGFSIPLAPEFDVEVYQVIYKTPYKHIDSLVNASGIVVFPLNRSCPSAMASISHGSFSKRTEVPSYDGPERSIGLFFAGLGGLVAALPDELGLGDSDGRILIHPYVNAFHSGYAAVNLMRACRELAAMKNIPLNGEIVLTGYSQGGYSSMATHKLIQENYANEFNIVAAAPMSGPYDLNRTMVDVMLDTLPYAVPAYLPYLLLGYHSVYPSLQTYYPTPSDIFNSPYDTVLPPLFYSKNYSLGDINAFSTPVPRDMLKDSVIYEFENDLNHPLRLILAENDLLGWTPQKPVKIHYCTGDDEVKYLNAVRADSAWRANGATDIQIQDFGNLSHAGCIEPAILSAAFFILGKISVCTGIDDLSPFAFHFYPNPANTFLNIEKSEGFMFLNLYNLNGKQVLHQTLSKTHERVDVQFLPKGFYILESVNTKGASIKNKLLLH